MLELLIQVSFWNFQAPQNKTNVLQENCVFWSQNSCSACTPQHRVHWRFPPLYRTRFGFQRECMPPPCKLKLIETHNVKGYETYRKPFVTHLQFSIVRSTSENRSTQVYINFCETDTTELSKQWEAHYYFAIWIGILSANSNLLELWPPFCAKPKSEKVDSGIKPFYEGFSSKWIRHLVLKRFCGADSQHKSEIKLRYMLRRRAQREINFIQKG